MIDVFGNRMKWYETECKPSIMPSEQPICIRLDGCNFSKFTKGLKKPFDPKLRQAMDETTNALMHETGAIVGYTQSDEITLILFAKNAKSQVYYNGKRDKINSILAAKCTLAFREAAGNFLPDTHQKPVVFDCRCFSVPTINEAANCVIWRMHDCYRNAISMIGQSKYSHKSLHKQSSNDILKRLCADGVELKSFPNDFRFGVLFYRDTLLCKFSAEDIEKLPMNHDARKNPDLMYHRNVVFHQSLSSRVDSIHEILQYFNMAQ